MQTTTNETENALPPAGVRTAVSETQDSPAAEVARMLLTASPGRVYGFALAMHQRAAVCLDECLARQWLAVLKELQRGWHAERMLFHAL